MRWPIKSAIYKKYMEAMQMDFSVGDIVQMKKTHPCGGTQWEILRTGIDFRIKCTTCGHMVMLPRTKFEKSVKKKISKTDN